MTGASVARGGDANRIVEAGLTSALALPTNKLWRLFDLKTFGLQYNIRLSGPNGPQRTRRPRTQRERGLDIGLRPEQLIKDLALRK
jgi:hypothetical protein